MNERNDERDSAFEKRAKELFDDSVAGLDAATRSRLNRARQRALEELAAPRRQWLWTLAPAGAVAAAAAVAWFVAWQPAPQPAADMQLATLSDLEILLGEEDLEMLDEEIDFYGWLEEQPEFANADDNVG
jgi:ferric-dicitrate binding protein FerR (iron transport regulator)